jgi:catalase
VWLRPGRDGQNRTTATSAAAVSRSEESTTVPTPPKSSRATKAAAKKPTPSRAATKKATARATAPKRSSNGVTATPRDDALTPSWGQRGDALTTSIGVKVDDTDNSLRISSRGPTLLEDFHLREKIMHFDHERIPERVVHARGAAAHGQFQLTTSLQDITSADFLCNTRQPTPVFLRFSTVAGSRGSADTARDVRGFATKFYTQQGNFDLVGNNIPIFFIQDGIKFPDLIHAAKPEPDREIPQAQTAHDSFWDFVSLTPESTHMLMWAMSDRAIPRSFRTMEGFGVHTFRLVNAKGKTSLVKFHWKPAAGVHSLVWEESQKLGGIDPDFHRRDLWNAIEAGAYPQWDLGVQVMPDSDDQFFHGIDLLDPTKIVPEELCPVRRVGTLTLDRNPANFFAETEQVAFCAGSFVPGIEPTDDPLLHARMFSYLDTQITRLGGPNFNQLPINRPAAEVNDNLRDGFGQQAIHTGRAPYAPNSIGGGCPFASVTDGSFVHVPQQVDGIKVRERAASFDDHFSQATLFWNSMTPPERDHIVGAFSFELANCESDVVVGRMLENLANVDAELCGLVAQQLGQPAPRGKPTQDAGSSPALSMKPSAPGPIVGRVVGVIAGDGVDRNAIGALDKRLEAEDAVLHVLAPHGGTIAAKPRGSALTVHKSLLTAQSVQYDAVVVADGPAADQFASDPFVGILLQEAYRHHKPIAAWGRGREVLAAFGIPLDANGVVVDERVDNGFGESLVESMGWHRHWER